MTAARIIAAIACLALSGAVGPVERLAIAQRDAARSAARVQALDEAARSAADEAARFNARAAGLAARVQQAEAGLATAEARNGLIREAIARRSHALAERQGKIVNLVAALESLTRRPPALVLVQPGSARDTMRVALLLNGVLPVLRARTADLRNELAALRRLRARADVARQDLASARAHLDDTRVQLVRMAAEQRKEAGGMATASMLESDRALALSVEAQDLRQLIKTLDGQAKLLQRLASLPGPLPRPAQIPHYALPPSDAVLTPSPDAAGQPLPRFLLPVLGDIRTGFGELSQSGVRSRGLTLRTRAKAQVIAPAAGRVVFAGPFRQYGNVVIIEHGEGLTTLLTGLDALDAIMGQTIPAGGPVGRMGETGQRELSLEVRKDGAPIDPLPLMTRN